MFHASEVGLIEEEFGGRFVVEFERSGVVTLTTRDRAPGMPARYVARREPGERIGDFMARLLTLSVAPLIVLHCADGLPDGV